MVLFLDSGLFEDCIQQPLGQVGGAVNGNGNRPVSFPYHDVVTAGNAIKTPAVCFQQLFKLFAGNGYIYTSYKVCVKWLFAFLKLNKIYDFFCSTAFFPIGG
jgi:hypothetical protein